MYFDALYELFSLKKHAMLPSSLPPHIYHTKLTPLKTFTQEVHDWYSDPNFDRDLDNDDLTVRAAFLCKKFTGLQHELVALVFTTKDDMRGDTLCVFERLPDTTEKSPFSMVPAAATALLAKNKFSSWDVVANDRFWCHGDNDWEGSVSSLGRRVVKALKDNLNVQDSPDYGIVACVDLSATHISLFTVAAILETASIHESCSNILRTNCAWFAAVCMCLLQTLPGAVEVRDCLHSTLKAGVFIGTQWSAFYSTWPKSTILPLHDQNVIPADELSDEDTLSFDQDTHGSADPLPHALAPKVTNNLCQVPSMLQCYAFRNTNPRSIQATYDEVRERRRASVSCDKEVSHLVVMRAGHQTPCSLVALCQARAPEVGGHIGAIARERDTWMTKYFELERQVEMASDGMRLRGMQT
ncbi:hypothetical protein EVG20_g2162 [Dentipellis fragilis]|uniref:Uncharacterized protein n=1 Tax=Dentipellis fragilis TaxID=205917 RepID=A0A4Y9Z9Z7_9AGAM|nr:hypothetical protein EVG20_g2162 [Dentipellis fragilis]